MRSFHTTIFLALFLPAAAALGEDYPVYDNGVLTLPRVDAPDQVGQYQGATFLLTPQGTWELTGLQVRGTETLYPVAVDSVEVVKTGTAPVSVYLRVYKYNDRACDYAGPKQAHQRLTGTRFEVDVSAPRMPSSPDDPIICTGDIRNYRLTVPLQIYGLGAGTYTYDVNGVSGSFTLDSDNKYADDCDEGWPPYVRCP
jgi:hypothetical protein